MYRKSSGKLGMDLFNVIGNLPGGLSSSTGADPGHISNPQRDSIYLYQLQFPNPCALTDETLYVSQIVDHTTTSHKIFKQLQKLDLITADGEVTTAGFEQPGFGKKYASHLAMIPLSRSRQIVDFLFWWDEEARRLRKLMEEREQLLALKASVDDAAQKERFQLLLDRVHMKISTRPSKRVDKVENDEDLADLEAAAAGTATKESAVGENPPAYR